MHNGNKFNAYKAEMEKIIMANTNTNHVPTNGNCKRVRDITNNIGYGSLTEAALAKGVRLPSMSYAVKHRTPCNGSIFVLESEIYKSGDILCAENAKANRRVAKAKERADRAEAKIAEMEGEMAEFRKWKAEQERIRKEKEEYEAAVAKAEDEVARRTKICNQLEAKLQRAVGRLMESENKLKSLKGNGEEVV